MRHTLPFAMLLLLMQGLLMAQDSSSIVVNRYLKMLGHDALPADSMLVISTTITQPNSSDTMLMMRYYQPDEMMRVEVWAGDSLTYAICTNGRQRMRRYYAVLERWDDMMPSSFRHEIQAYDFRGPLYDYANRGIAIGYTGRVSIDGHPLQVVRAEQRGRYNRSYFFEPQSGLLVLITESRDMPEGSPTGLYPVSPIDYKFFHEYLPLPNGLIPSEESFSRDGVLQIMRSTAHFEPRNDLLFNQD